MSDVVADVEIRPLRVRIEYDDSGSVEVPDSDDLASFFRLADANPHHTHHVDPDELYRCEDCGYGRHSFAADELDEDGQDPEGFDHPYRPANRIVCILNYFEHGRCRWSRGDVDPAGGFDPGGWDTSRSAGALILNPEYADEWDELDPDRQIEIIDSFLDEFTAWANGDVFGYVIDRPIKCECCGNVEFEHVDSCWGFIVGWDWKDEHRSFLADEIKSILAAEFEVEVEDLAEGIHYTLAGDLADSFL